MQGPNGWTLVVVCAAAIACAGDRCMAQDGHEAPPAEGDHQQESTSRFSDEPIPLKLEGFPERPKPILELGSPFLGTGTLDPGFEMPGGAVWQPSLLVYGSYRTAIQTFDNGDDRITEWVNRLDIFGNLQLTGTERVLIGFRPLDRNNRFSSYVFEPDDQEGWEDGLNGVVTTLFFEGDLGEIFSNSDPDDFGSSDWGFAVGRQPLFFQEGMLINDTIDGVAIVRDTLFPKGGSDLRLTFFYGWNDVNRDDNQDHSGTRMYAIFTEADFPKQSIQLDAVYVDDENGDTDGLYWGAGTVLRVGHLNVAARAMGSYALDEESPEVSDGYLLFGELSLTPHHTHDIVYLNGFYGIDQFASAARGADTGGPLGRTGLLFAAVGMGQYGAALGNRADDSFGGSLGWQMFFDDTRKQLILEIGGRASTEDSDLTVYAVGGRYEQAIGQHAIFRLDTFWRHPEHSDDGYGGRVELELKF